MLCLTVLQIHITPYVHRPEGGDRRLQERQFGQCFTWGAEGEVCVYGCDSGAEAVIIYNPWGLCVPCNFKSFCLCIS